MIDKLVMRVLEWAAGHHDEGRYSPVAIVFHWTMTALVFAQLGLGWWMGRLATGGDKVLAHQTHYAIGFLMLTLVIGRFAWRSMAPGPINDADKKGWESKAAVVTHWLFYICLFGLPLSGWLLVSSVEREQALTVAGLFPWPHLPLQSLDTASQWRIMAVAERLHWGLIVTLLLLIPIHVGAALKHQLIDRDDVFHAMLPVLPKPTPLRTRWQRRYRAIERRVASLAKALWRPFRIQ